MLIHWVPDEALPLTTSVPLPAPSDRPRESSPAVGCRTVGDMDGFAPVCGERHSKYGKYGLVYYSHSVSIISSGDGNRKSGCKTQRFWMNLSSGES